MLWPDTLPYIASQSASDDFIMIVISVGGETMITDINEIIHHIRCVWLLATGYSIGTYVYDTAIVIITKRLDKQIIITFFLPR